MNLGDGLGEPRKSVPTTDAMPDGQCGPGILMDAISWSPRFILCSGSRCGHIHRHEPGDENGDVECAGDCLHDRESPREFGHRSYVAKADRAQGYEAEVEGIEAIHPAGRMAGRCECETIG